MSDGTCAAVTTVIQNCYIYRQGSGCATCASNFKLQAGQCVQDRSGCITFDAAGTCVSCGFGTFTFGGQCEGILNCQDYSGIDSCAKCLPGFTLDNRICSSSVGCISPPVQGICQACSAGYVLSGYSCVSASVNLRGCAIYSPTGICVNCK